MSTPPYRILGVDPGLASTGAGIIECRGDVWRLVESCEARTSSAAPLPRRLRALHDLVARMIELHQPSCMAIESLFFAKNVRSAVMMAHGRGVAILAASNANIPVHEYSPLEIKQSVVGKGRASKSQVMQMVKVLLALPHLPESDHQADALACALAHAYRSRLDERINSVPANSAGLATPSEEINPAKLLLAQIRRGRRRR